MEWKESLSEITKTNGAITSLKELLVKTAYQEEMLTSTFTPMFNVGNGKHLGWVGDMDDIGWEGAPCNPEYRTPNVQLSEKVWEIGKWSAPLKWCYEDFENTIAEYALKKGTDMGDLTNTEIWQILISDPMERALNKMYWRLIWFGDTQGANLTEGVDKTLFTPTDGLWKRLFEVATNNSSQRTEISANSEDTMAGQKETLNIEGTAVNLFDKILSDADSRIASLEGAAIYCTKSLRDALTKDMKDKYHIQLDWSQIVNGVEVSEYNGTKVVSVSVWDRMIKQYQNNGTKLNMPHRAFFGTPKQLFVGTPANSIISDIEIFFNQDERVTKAYIAGKIGTLIGEDELFQIAY